jgi:diphthamide synthase (EF-2-diphthine--ammonia ligase)
MMTEGGQRSRSHGLSREVLQAQSDRIGVPIRFWPPSWDDYEATFRAAVAEAVADGARLGVFGDLDIEDHRRWVEQQCVSAGARSWLPLWKRDHYRAVRDLLDAGVGASIVAVRAGIVPRALLGRDLDHEVLDERAAPALTLPERTVNTTPSSPAAHSSAGRCTLPRENPRFGTACGSST